MIESPDGGLLSGYGLAPDLQGGPVPMRLHHSEELVDAVVIGSGAGGAPLAARLAGAGLSVVVLEAGRHWAPARDFATDEQEQSKLFWTDERLCAGADPVPFGKNNSGIGVGGSTLHYTAYVPRPQPDDFRLASEFGIGRIGRSATPISSPITTSSKPCSACRDRPLIRGGPPASLTRCRPWR